MWKRQPPSILSKSSKKKNNNNNSNILDEWCGNNPEDFGHISNLRNFLAIFSLSLDATGKSVL